ncbi:hypothetical protein [Chryseobacterium jejuense]|uniref:Uncharacterized protein n=1 Tax=Chryseobacterium jejuense TaxID=445960 RepID=A0A2X2VAN6_CHRJE|nr:hypothetical protein [Chryseobacterium jejuense]SDJ11097.1 hypothetical protein SAMN05421542_2678 [Chryseobacterium jejuense]SQB27912.1 Uncharacterised protein [Chryseobacterium jejuense]
MKKNKTDLKTRCRINRKKYSALQQIEAFFQFNDLVGSKELLNRIVSHAVRRNSRIDADSVVIFQFHQAVRSLIRAGYLIMLKERKWVINTQLEKVSPLLFGLLSEEEYQNPLLVFQKAFSEYSIKEFDYFMSGMVYFSMGVYENLPEKNIINPYIHLIKMLDAAHLILERREEKG